MLIESTINFIRKTFNTSDFIQLHTPYFGGNEKKYLEEAIDSTYVSSVGPFVDLFEKNIAAYTGAKYGVACVNGTAALHVALLVSDVRQNDEVLSQALTFVATANAISYIGAQCVFIDVDRDTMGMSSTALSTFLQKNAYKKEDGFTYNKASGKRIKACVPMHTFGLPCRIDEIADICKTWNISLIEDGAESLGSYYKGRHTGNYGIIGTFSFNGNKTITCGGGGALITDDEHLARRMKHLTTQAKVPHPWKFRHDEIGYNYRMPNLNAALACAQLEQLEDILCNKRALSDLYVRFFQGTEFQFVTEVENSRSNYWLNALILKDEQTRDVFLQITNANSVMTRPIWDLMSSLPMFEHCQHDELKNSKWLVERVVNIPSGYRTHIR